MGGKREWSRREGAFAPMPECWIRPLMEAGAIPQYLAVFLVLMLHRFDGPGDAIYASYPADRIAEELGISTASIKVDINKLRSKGAVRLVKKGYRGATSVYELMPYHPWRKGYPDDNPIGRKGYQSDQKGLSSRYPMGYPVDIPNRKKKYKEAGSAREPLEEARADREKEPHVNSVLDLAGKTSVTPEELRAIGIFV